MENIILPMREKSEIEFVMLGSNGKGFRYCGLRTNRLRTILKP